MLIASALIVFLTLPGATFQAMGARAFTATDFPHARVLFQAALEHEPRSVTRAAILANLAASECHLGNYTAAVERYRQALDIRESALGPSHADTLMSLKNLGYALRRSGQSRQALDRAAPGTAGYAWRQGFLIDALVRAPKR